ncbi:MAG: hypothetical protein ABIR70_17350 [Bryobacteraceae bacterium]
MRTLFLTLVTAGLASAQTCDKACLENFVDLYMEALIAHKPAQVAMAPKVKNTEDGVRLDPGDGFWRTAMGKGSYRLFNTDVENGQVVFMGTMREVPNLAVIVMIRLKVANKQITEVENFVVRDAAAAKAFEDRGRPAELFTAVIPAAQRTTRAALIQTANSYLTGLQRNDGKGTYNFAPDCDRFQNGTQTTNRTTALPAPPPPGRGAVAAPPDPLLDRIVRMSCLDQFKSGFYNFATRVRDRRFVAVDRERGLVTAIFAIDHASGKYRTFKMADGKEVSSGPMKPETLAVAETFKIEAGKIRRIEAIQINVPYGMVTGWSTWEDGMTDKPQDLK